jgi:hypothetical protein
MGRKPSRNLGVLCRKLKRWKKVKNDKRRGGEERLNCGKEISGRNKVSSLEKIREVEELSWVLGLEFAELLLLSGLWVKSGNVSVCVALLTLRLRA